jgi:Cu(I)/Ag(I) efflux system protein CusF
MNARKALLAILLAGATLPVQADMAGMDMHAMNHAQASSQNMPLSEGVIRKVDAAAGKVTIRHGELANLGMPAMTMTFTAKDKAMLKNLKVGDKVRFRADESDDGGLMVSQMTKLR